MLDPYLAILYAFNASSELDTFSNFTQSDDAVAAYNVAKYTSNKRAYVDSVASKTSAELNSYYTNQSKKVGFSINVIFSTFCY